MVSSDSGSSPEDEALLARFNEGDARAFGTLLERYRRPLFTFILRLVRDRDQAETLWQDTFVRIARRARKFKAQSKFSTWLYIVAHKLCIDKQRKKGVRRARSFKRRRPPGARSRPTPDGERGSVEKLEAREMDPNLDAALSEAVDALPLVQREVFLLRELENLPFRDVAAVVGVSEDEAKSRMRSALARLQAALTDEPEYVAEASP